MISTFHIGFLRMSAPTCQVCAATQHIWGWGRRRATSSRHLKKSVAKKKDDCRVPILQAGSSRGKPAADHQLARAHATMPRVEDLMPEFRRAAARYRTLPYTATRKQRCLAHATHARVSARRGRVS